MAVAYVLAAVGARCLALLTTAAVARSLDHRTAEGLHGLSSAGVVDNKVQHFLHRLNLQGVFGHFVRERFDDAGADLALGLFQEARRQKRILRIYGLRHGLDFLVNIHPSGGGRAFVLGSLSAGRPRSRGVDHSRVLRPIGLAHLLRSLARSYKAI